MGFTGDSIKSELHRFVKRVFCWPLWNQELVHFAVVESPIQDLADFVERVGMEGVI